MADYSRQLTFIAQCSDPKSLRTLIQNARWDKAPDVEKAAFKRLVSLVPGEEPGTVEHDFWTMLNVFEEQLKEERGRTTLLSRTRQKVARVGVIQTLSDWATGPETDGFKMLLERDMVELTGEAIVLRHADRFSPEVLSAARKRLEGAGILEM